LRSKRLWSAGTSLQACPTAGQGGPLPLGEGVGLDEFEPLTRKRAYLADASVCRLRSTRRTQAGEDPKGKSRQAEPGRPAIYIE